MTTSNRGSVTSGPERAYVGAAMLKKRRKMTPQQAYYLGRLGKADLHIHSTYSDGVGTIKQILEHVQHQTDLDVIAITDHDVIEGSLHARDLWVRGEYRFDFVVGEEVSTREGHLLGLFIEKHIPPALSMEHSIDLIHEQGGLAVIAHPLHPLFRHSCQRNVMDRIHANPDVWFDGIETWNASFCGVYANYLAMSANRESYGLPELGNSDAHTLNAIGRGYTWFEGKSAQNIRTVIKEGLSASAGKLWYIGDYVHWACYRMSKSGREASRAWRIRRQPQGMDLQDAQSV